MSDDKNDPMEMIDKALGEEVLSPSDSLLLLLFGAAIKRQCKKEGLCDDCPRRQECEEQAEDK